jgi:hypothetical protein
MPRCGYGSPNSHASRCTTPQPIPPGSTRSNVGSVSSPSKPSAAEASETSNTSSPKSTTSSSTITRTAAPSHGPQRPIPSSRNSHDFVHVFPGRNTSCIDTVPPPVCPARDKPDCQDDQAKRHRDLLMRLRGTGARKQLFVGV